MTPPSLWHFSENSSDLAAGPFPISHIQYTLSSFSLRSNGLESLQTSLRVTLLQQPLHFAIAKETKNINEKSSYDIKYLEEWSPDASS